MLRSRGVAVALWEAPQGVAECDLRGKDGKTPQTSLLLPVTRWSSSTLGYAASRGTPHLKRCGPWQEDDLEGAPGVLDEGHWVRRRRCHLNRPPKLPRTSRSVLLAEGLQVDHAQIHVLCTLFTLGAVLQWARYPGGRIVSQPEVDLAPEYNPDHWQHARCFESSGQGQRDSSARPARCQTRTRKGRKVPGVHSAYLLTKLSNA